MKYDLTAERSAYNVLKNVFLSRAYSTIELDRALDNAPDRTHGKITALVYGVLEKSIRLDYIIDALAKAKVKNNIDVLLKMGLYELLYGNEPAYAVVDRYVTFAKDRFPGTQGFVNAILRHAGDVTIDETRDDDISLSVRFSQPRWLVESLVGEFGRERTISILSAEKKKATHIRHNSRKISAEDFAKIMTDMAKEHKITPTGLGYYVTRSTMRALRPDVFTAQSLASMYAVNIYAEDYKGKAPRVLDLCAAPGGKSVYFGELVPDADITACDLHFHRAQLIGSYAGRMSADNIKICVNDASELREEWIDGYDVVICDVPCSGSGLLVSSPDILLFKSESDVSSLGRLQSEIIRTAARYVKTGGELMYSTCSIFAHENERVVREFLAERPDFELVPTSLPYGSTKDGMTRLFPDTDGCDGFFIAKMRRKA